MAHSGLLKAGIFLFSLILVGSLYYLTREEADDLCTNPQADISGAVLAEDGDQDALINRAIIMKGGCEEVED